jgi:hypothetical protein
MKPHDPGWLVNVDDETSVVRGRVIALHVQELKHGAMVVSPNLAVEAARTTPQALEVVRQAIVLGVATSVSHGAHASLGGGWVAVRVGPRLPLTEVRQAAVAHLLAVCAVVLGGARLDAA